MEKWFVMRKGAPFQEIAEKFQIHPVLARLIRNRDVVGDENIQMYLHGTIADLYDGMLMKDMDKAVDILLEKIHEDKKIRVIGDYDIDGINATYILLEGIRALGGDVDIDIPDRMTDGYGLNRNLIDRAFDADVDTIITCDNGIAAKEEIAQMQKVCEELMESLLFKNPEVIDWHAEIACAEQRIDDMTKEYRNNMYDRIKSGVCQGEGSILFSEMLTDFERIGDHALNISDEMTKIRLVEPQ